jgi:hypothetical protein
MNAEMQIYLPVALPYPVQCPQLFKRPNQVPYGRDYKANDSTEYNAGIVSKLQYQECNPKSDPD